MSLYLSCLEIKTFNDNYAIRVLEGDKFLLRQLNIVIFIALIVKSVK